MNKQSFPGLLTLFFLIVCTTSCEVEEQIHPRMKYIGDYNFEIKKYFWSENNGTTWKPSTYYDGYVAPDSVSPELLVVKCGEGDYNNLSYHFSTRFIEFGDGSANASFGWPTGHGGLRGEFIGTDSLVIKASDGGLGGGYGYEIFGKRTREW